MFVAEDGDPLHRLVTIYIPTMGKDESLENDGPLHLGMPRLMI